MASDWQGLKPDALASATMGWKEVVLSWFDAFGPASLAAISFSEAIIQPIPPDLVFMPMLFAERGNYSTVLFLWLVITISSVLGSIVGYWIGKKWGRALIERFGGQKHILKLEALFARYGTLGIFIAAFSPIPYKVFSWFAGMGEMDVKPFIWAGLIGRGLRFGLEALVIGIYGQVALDKMMWLLDRELIIAILLIIGCAALYFAWKWWDGIAIETETS